METAIIQERLKEFTIKSVEHFIREHPEKTFNGFAYDCNVEYAEINLCFNTDEYFQNTLRSYQNGSNKRHYLKEENITKLRYSVGDWAYQCYDSVDVLSPEELETQTGHLTNEEWSLAMDQLLADCTQTLIDFTQTPTYALIPKTDAFIVLCIDHDEEMDEAIERINTMRAK